MQRDREAISGVYVTGERAGQRVRRRRSIPKRAFAQARCASVHGGSLFTPPPAWKRPIVSSWRGYADTSFGRPWQPGVCRSWMRNQIVLSPEELLEKLAALVPAAVRGRPHRRSDGIDWPGRYCWLGCSNLS